MDAPQPANRALSSAHILGWDFLRGLCALAVAAYHLMSWLEVAHWHSLGTHGVYIFFVLSGASLAYTYSPQINARSFDFPGFLFLRYFRLAPLFLLLVALSLPWKLHKDGFTLALITDVMLNATFLFGIYQPIQHSLLVGGWSLGIEVVFYMAFPLMLATLRRPVLAIGLFVCLLVVQASWIAATVGSPDGYEATLVAYHHAPAFAAYFFVGCIIGWRRRFNTGGRLWQKHLDGFSWFWVCSVCMALALSTRVINSWDGAVSALRSCARFWWISPAGFSGENRWQSWPNGSGTPRMVSISSIRSFTLA